MVHTMANDYLLSYVFSESDADWEPLVTSSHLTQEASDTPASTSPAVSISTTSPTAIRGTGRTASTLLGFIYI